MAYAEIFENIRKDITNDTIALIENFSKHQKPDFKTFCKEWKLMGINYMYSILMQNTEYVQLTEEFFITAKDIFLNTSSLLHRIGVFYFMYAIYFKQPTRQWVKIKLDLKTFNSLKSFIQELQEQCDVYEEVLYIFHKLVQSNAFKFVASESDYGFEEFYEASRKKLKTVLVSQKIKTAFANDFKELNDETSGLLNEIEAIENEYHELKNEIAEQMVEQLESNKIADKLQIHINLAKNILTTRGRVRIPDLKSDSDSESQSSEHSDIGKRRKLLKSRSISNRAGQSTRENDEENNQTEDGSESEYDTVQVTRKNKEYFSYRMQPASKILNANLPKSILAEFNDEKETEMEKEIQLSNPTASTSYNIEQVDKSKRKRRRRPNFIIKKV